MKRLMILTFAVMMLSSAIGCRTCERLWNRGAECNACGSPAADMYSLPPGAVIESGPTVQQLPPQ